MSWGLEKLSEEHRIPKEFTDYMKQVRKLDFEQKPDYIGLRGIFKELFYKLGFEYDYQFDWVVKNKQLANSIEGNSSSQFGPFALRDK